MATNEIRGVSVDAISDPSPSRSSLATDFVRELALAVSDSIAIE